MSDTHFPNDQRRIEVRILIPTRDHPDPLTLAKEINEAVRDVALQLTDLPFWYATDFIESDEVGPIDWSWRRPDLTVVEGGNQ